MFLTQSRFCHMFPPAMGVGSTRVTLEPVVPPTLLPSALLGSNRNGPVSRGTDGLFSSRRMYGPPVFQAAPPNAMKRSAIGRKPLLS